VIISVTVNSRINTDLNISHRTEVIVETEDEARAAGSEFWGIVLAFNKGLADKAEEIG
jgi:hypothetical protein